MVFHVFIFIFSYLEQTVKKDNSMRTTPVTFMVIFSKVSFSKSVDTATGFKGNSILKDTLLLKMYEHQNLSKNHKTKINESAWKIISRTKIRACTLKNISPNR